MANTNRRSAFSKAFTFVDLSKIPGPRGVDYFNYVKHFQRDILGAFTQVNRDFGDIGSFPWPMNSIIIYSPEFARSVLVENHKKYIKGEQIEELRAVVGEGLATNNDYESWLRSRTIISKEFSTKAILEFNQTFERLCLEHIKDWKRGTVIDICEEMKYLTFKIACETLLGVNLSLEDAKKVNEAVHFTSQVTYERIFQFFPVPYWMPTEKNKKFNQHFENLRSIVLKLIHNEKKQNNPNPSSVLERLVHSGLTENELVDEALTMLLAGHETSAHSLTWTIGLLAKHQDVQDKLRNSLESSYLSNVLMESMRLYPAFPVLSRKANEDTQLGDYFIPKNTNVVIPIFVMQRNSANFPDALTFDPERFSSPETQKSFAYLPFSKGQRKCIAEAFAMSEMSIIICQLLKHFRFELTEKDLPDCVASVSLKPVNGLKVRIL